MLEELVPNLHEELARRVDFGHTFSYGRRRHEHRLLHGGRCCSTSWFPPASRARGLLSAFEADRIFALVEALTRVDYGVLDTDLMWASLLDRSSTATAQRVPMPTALTPPLSQRHFTRRA